MTMSMARWEKPLRRWCRENDVDCIDRMDSRYETARRVFNRFHDLHPAMIVYPSSSSHVSHIVQVAAAGGIQLAVRGGGHHVAGFGTCDRGIVVDFSRLRGSRVDRQTGVLHAQPGMLLSDLDLMLCPQGLVVPSGTVSCTGLAGLTLGGGIGWLIGCRGLTCDHLVGADVVLADGRLVQAENPEHNSLLWGLRGGGGNFGIIIAFRFRTTALPPVTVGSAIVDYRHAPSALYNVCEFLSVECPRSLSVASTLVRRDERQPALAVDFCLSDLGSEELTGLRDAVGPADWQIWKNASFVNWQQASDSKFHPMRGYWKARYGAQPSRSDVGHLIGAFADAPSDQCSVLIEHLHGAIHDMDETVSAFPLRSSQFGVLMSARWTDATQDDAAIGWVRSNFTRLSTATQSSTYSNYASFDDTRVYSQIPGSIADRLRETKLRYDPTNLFSRNHSIRVPATR